jgi:hypothetical protein
MARWITLLRALWRIAAGFFGFFVIQVATTAGFAPLGDIIQVTAPFRIHVLATLVALVSGVAGGLAATLAGGGASRVPVIVTSMIVTAESTYIVLYLRGHNPVWFEVLGAGTLLGATVAGGLLARRWVLARRARRSDQPAHA